MNLLAQSTGGLDVSTVGFIVTSLLAMGALAIPIYQVLRARRRQGLDD